MSWLAGARGRFAVGLALGLVLALGLTHWVLGRARADLARQEVERTAMVRLGALTELVTRAGGEGDAVRQVVDRFAEETGFETVRVISLPNRTVEASTTPEDTGDNAPPRRMVREEKDLYDQGQRLRAAVETNRQEGVFRKEEVELTPEAGGGLALAAPVEIGGEVTGAVLVSLPPQGGAPGAGLSLPLAVGAGALALFLLPTLVAGERKWLLALFAVALLAVAVVVYAQLALGQLRDDRQQLEQEIAARVAAMGEKANAVAGSLGLAEPPLAPESWDADIYRRPWELVSAAGEIDQQKVSAALADARQRMTRFGAGAFVVGLGLLLFVGLGQAARLLTTLRRHRLAYFYILPAIVSMLVLVFFPFGYGIALSFTEATLYNEDQTLLEKWTGLDNYVDIITDTAVVKSTEGGRSFDYENFYWTLGFTIVWTVVNVAYGVTLGLLLALVLNRQGLVLKPIYRVLLILPWAVPNYITALIWKGMFHQQFGVINQIIQMFGIEPVAWFDGAFTSFLAIWATNGWLSFPFMMVISLGALQSIPGDLYEAARVDGASRFQQFRSITLPSLKPALVPAVILSVIWTFNMFNIPYLTSGGEPAGATEILITGAYKIAFQKYQYGYAAAYATIIFFILLAYGIWQNKVTKATEGI